MPSKYADDKILMLTYYTNIIPLPYLCLSVCAGDSLRYHSGRPFSTKDKDPNPLSIHCAKAYQGGWWYKNCYKANLNGLYATFSENQVIHNAPVIMYAYQISQHFILYSLKRFQRTLTWLFENSLLYFPFKGVVWIDWKGKDVSIPFTEMKFRPASFLSVTQG